jgi:hypothetical protein
LTNTILALFGAAGFLIAAVERAREHLQGTFPRH